LLRTNAIVVSDGGGSGADVRASAARVVTRFIGFDFCF